MNIPWIAAFCDTPSNKDCVTFVSRALEKEFGHVLKPREPIAWQKAAAGVIKYLGDHGVIVDALFPAIGNHGGDLGEDD